MGVFSTIADFQISASDKYKPAAVRIIEYISKSSEKNVKLSSEGADSLYQQEKSLLPSKRILQGVIET